MLPGCNPHVSEMNYSEERDNDPETPTTRASLGSPGFVPPVIFAGLASPSTGSRPATQKRFNQFLRSSKAARGGRRGSQDGGVSTEQSDFSKAYQKRSQSVCCYKTSATVANESVCDTGLISQLSTSPFLTSPSQRSSTDGVDDPSGFVKHDDPPFQKSRFSLLSVSSSRLNTPRMPPRLHTEDCKNSLLEQITELEAALAHSKARETLFSHSYDKLREEVAAKDAKLEEREVLLETLEQEHRRVKASFRELMDATLNTSIPETVSSETMHDEKINETPNVFMTDVDATGTAPEATSVSETRQKQRSWYSAFTQLRGTKESTTDENVAAQGAELQQKLVQVEELLTTLRGTNNYVQKVLQRNSELEQRCTQLEEGRDERIRELHNELSRARRDRDASEALAARLKHELEQSSEQIGVLHRELRDMHEKQRLRRVLVHELQDVKDENESLRDILAAEKLEAQRAAMEWEQEKALLQADLAFAQRKITATTASRDQETHETPPNILAQRIGELEELLSNNRQEMQEKVNELREKHADAEKSLRTISQRLEAAQKHESELKNSVTNFESENTMLRTQLAKAQHDVCLLRAENATLNERALEVEEVKAKLQAAQEQLDSQTKQINRHLQTIKNANERYAELVESKTVLDCLLHSQQKEKEKTIAETVRTHEQLYDQSNSYRQRLEKANRETAELRKQLAEGEEQLQNAVQSVEVTKLKEVRQIKEQYAQSKRVVISDYDKKLTQLRESYEKDIAEFRQQKEEMTDALVAQYEGYLKELKSVHEKKLQYVQETKETALQKLRDELTKRVADIQALTKERLSKQRELHEEELNALRSMYHKNLQNQLQHQAKEAEELRRSLDTLRQDSDQRLMVANQKVEELSALLQQHRLRETQSEEERDTAWAQVLTERDSLRLALSDIASKHQEELKKLEESHKEALAFLERKLTLSQSLLEESQHEENRLRSKLEEVQAEEIKLRQHLLERTVRAETEKTTETATTSVVQITGKENRQNGSSDMGPANVDKTFSVTPFVEPTVVQELQESLNLAESAVKQLQERLEHETQLLQSQLDAKEERLQSFLKTQQHVTDILARNSELEDTMAKDAQRFSELLEKKSDELTQLEAVNARLEHLVKEQGTQLTSLQSQLECAEVQLQRLNNMALKEKETQSIIASQQNRISELLERLEEASGRNNDLADNTKHVSNGEGSAVLKDSDMVAQSRRHLDSLKLLADELAVTRNENRRLLREMEELHEAAKESSRISLELALLKHRVETQEETIEILRERSQNKQAVIDELTTQLRSQSSNDEEPDPVHSTDSQAQLQTKIQELTRKCQQLENQKLCYEHDRRAAQHRIELEQQILAQCMEQKERQMRHLIETNQRAEALFARNAELEALLYTLQTERESHRCSVSAPNRSLTASKLKQDEMITQQETTSTCSTESESLQAMLKDKEERIHKLMEELRVSKALYMKEIETLTTRLHFATLEQSLVPLSSEDDLLKLLVEKTTELQREVARLQKERDENRVPSGSSGQRCSASWRDDDVIHLQTRIETLLGEREALRKQVSHLVSSCNGASTAPHLSTATSNEASIAHGLSLRCRLELILKRYRNALDFLTSDPGSIAFFVKEMVHLNMEMDTFIREMDESSPRTTELTDSAVMSETESISTRTSLSNVVTREHSIEANESISVIVRSSSDHRSKYPSLEDKESDGFSGLQSTSAEAESTQPHKDSTCYNETASIETDLQQDDENKYPVPLPERSASRRSKRHRGVPTNTAAVKQAKRTSFHQYTAAPLSANLAGDTSVEEAKTTKEPANA